MVGIVVRLCCDVRVPIRAANSVALPPALVIIPPAQLDGRSDRECTCCKRL